MPTIWSVIPESSTTILEASFSLINDDYSTSITYDGHQLMIIICSSTGHGDMENVVNTQKEPERDKIPQPEQTLKKDRQQWVDSVAQKNRTIQ